MKLTPEIHTAIEKSVLCWLATVSSDGTPNVSPKEMFTTFGDQIIIANIASPQTIRNIKEQSRVCLSFIDILVQKGYQVKGSAQVVSKGEPGFSEMEKLLLEMTGELFPFRSITCITIESAKPILAPRYLLFPDTKESDQVERARKTYGL